LLGYHGNSINKPLHSNERLPKITHVGGSHKLSLPPQYPNVWGGGSAFTGNAMEGLLKPGPPYTWFTYTQRLPGHRFPPVFYNFYLKMS
jgi:hypothetical protein